MAETEKSITIALGAVGDIGENFKVTLNATSAAWSTGVGDQSKVESADQYLEGVYYGVKSVWESAETKKGSANIAKSVAIVASEINTATKIVTSTIGDKLEKSEKWKKSIRDLGKSATLIGTAIFKYVTTDLRERQLPPEAKSDE